MLRVRTRWQAELPSMGVLERLKGGLGERRYWGQMTAYLFPEPSRNINSPGSGKIRSKYTGHQSQHAVTRGVTFDASGNELITS